MSEQLINYLIAKGYTSRQAGELLNKNKSTILREARKYGKKFHSIPKRPDLICSKQIKVLIKRGYSDIEIAKLLNKNPSSINRIIKKNGLVRNTKVKLSKRQKALIVGTMLGDASFRIGNSTSISFAHSLKQKEYCLWKASQLKELNPKSFTFKSKKDERTNKHYYGVSVYTSATESLTKMAKSFYKPKKGIPKEYLEKYYNPLAMAVHYMDDGSKYNKTYGIATHSFSKKDLQVFNKICKSKFGIEWNIRKDNSLYLPVRYSRTFKKLIKPYIHQTLMYKLH